MDEWEGDGVDLLKLVARVIATLICSVILAQVAFSTFLAISQVDLNERTEFVRLTAFTVVIASLGLWAQYRLTKRVSSASPRP